MRIALTVGHSLLKNGSYTSASGEDCGGVNEYKYNKKLMKKVKKYLESDGHSVDVYLPRESIYRCITGKIMETDTFKCKEL